MVSTSSLSGVESAFCTPSIKFLIREVKLLLLIPSRIQSLTPMSNVMKSGLKSFNKGSFPSIVCCEVPPLWPRVSTRSISSPDAASFWISWDGHEFFSSIPVATVYESPIATYRIGFAWTAGMIKTRCVSKVPKIIRLNMMGPPLGDLDAGWKKFNLGWTTELHFDERCRSFSSIEFRVNSKLTEQFGAVCVWVRKKDAKSLHFWKIGFL